MTTNKPMPKIIKQFISASLMLSSSHIVNAAGSDPSGYAVEIKNNWLTVIPHTFLLITSPSGKEYGYP